MHKNVHCNIIYNRPHIEAFYVALINRWMDKEDDINTYTHIIYIYIYKMECYISIWSLAIWSHGYI